jgi:hypothetical protein
MKKFIKVSEIGKIAIGLNIEGCRPTYSLPSGCDWYNIILAVDEPMRGNTFDDVMKKVNTNKYQYIEQAIENFDVEKYINQMVTMIQRIKESNDYNKILIHVHQYTGTTILDKTLEEKTGIKTILDTTNFFESPINYSKQFPDIDCLISISQCASVNFECRAGTLIVSDGFLNFDVGKNTIDTNKLFATNFVTKYLDGINYKIGTILVVNDLWNPTEEEIKHSTIELV